MTDNATASLGKPAKQRIDCLKCKRWKLFGEASCPLHPDFKTQREIDDAEWRAQAEKLLKVMMYTAALRTLAPIDKTSLLDNTFSNLSHEPEDVQAAVMAEVERLGLMSLDELTQSLFMAIQMERRVCS